jgi:hypothetical protein
MKIGLAIRPEVCYNLYMKIEEQIMQSITIWRSMVENSGGQWVGVQMPIFCDGGYDDEPCIMFTRVNSTTLLSLPVSKITQEAVDEKLGRGEQRGRNVTKFQKMENQLHQALAQVDDAISALHTIREIIEEIQNAD